MGGLHHLRIDSSGRGRMLSNRFRLALLRLHRPAPVKSLPVTGSLHAFEMPSPPQPDLPNPAHVEKDSALGRKFGKEVVNYFGSSPLNRLSFLRDEHDFLAGAFDHPSTRFLCFNNLAPLQVSATEIHYATLKDIESLVPENPFAKKEKEVIDEFDSRKTHPQFVFLGIDEKANEGYTFRNFRGAP